MTQDERNAIYTQAWIAANEELKELSDQLEKIRFRLRGLQEMVRGMATMDHKHIPFEASLETRITITTGAEREMNRYHAGGK